MGLQAQMKTSLPWPFSMLTLLLGMATGPASGMAVSAPFTCGRLQDAPAQHRSGWPGIKSMSGAAHRLRS